MNYILSRYVSPSQSTLPLLVYNIRHSTFKHKYLIPNNVLLHSYKQRFLTMHHKPRSSKNNTIANKFIAYKYNTVTGYKKTFNKLLIANRGEIACRIIKTAKSMGIRTVAVYSDLDMNSLHVQLADESVRLGPGEPADSYLSIDRIVSAATSTGCDAVHPGYGFLSENPHFVEALTKNHILFVGPSAWAISAMGDKIQSKKLAEASGVNVIPGYHGEILSFEHAKQVAHDIGYPVMIKASAGGGGKGMRIAWTDSDLKDGYMLAKQESRFAFGDDRLLVEKYIDQPRHIEIQVLGDKHGNVIYLPERECSIQRRNQKVIEESPSVHLDDATRKAMGEQAVALAQHVGYHSAGTVEFLVDKERNFYFLEMNTRLQVEHPITEYVTGLDLVEQMIYSAAGYPLSLKQTDIKVNGWAIEARVYAEDPKNYLPSIGRLLTYQEPQIDMINDNNNNNQQYCPTNNSIRCDSGFIEGSSIHVEYDPLICKLATHGETRQEAMDTMIKALDEYVIKGVTHNIPLLRGVVAHPKFQSGNISTHFLANEYPDGFRPPTMTSEDIDKLSAIVCGMWMKKEQSRLQQSTTLFNNNKPLWVQLTNDQNEKISEVKVTTSMLDQQQFEVLTSNFSGTFSIHWPLDGLLSRTQLQDGSTFILQYLDTLESGFRVQYRGSKFNVTVLNEQQHRLLKYMKTKSKEQQSEWIQSPMPGRIISIAIKEGDQVQSGEPLVVVEAMKMQNILRSTRNGIVKKIYVYPGNNVKSGQVLIEFQES
ncbi:carbamoyl-phosphate synthase L chain, ATP binding domain-containing protein [Cunninghamella echinulata]|nr:carbamoyl-phosphate synthase L chain, ATP binding domain-containing protein [Cunninghamella echinulata]